MKKNIAIISFLLLSLSIAGQNLQTEGSQYVSGKLSVYPAGTTPDNGYNGNITITKPASTGQYINLIRQGNYPWSIGMVYNTNNFAIGNAVPNDQNFSNPFFVIGDNGNVGIGVTSPQSKLDLGGDMQLSGILGYRLFDNFLYDNKTMGHYSIGWFSDSWTDAGATQWHSSFGGFKFFTGGMPRVSIKHNGYVGIGTTNPTDILSVNGTIRAKEVKIDLCEDLADYVFSPEYKLMPLFEVEKFVKLNRHLPEIPSAADVKENGLNMGEMQNKLLQKIEELTLYVIEQQKRIEQLEKNQK